MKTLQGQLKKHTELELMMSKEKELLKRSVRIIESLGPDYEAYNLIDKIEELLAQPEQPEPVYWENEKKALLNEIDHLTNRLAQPELSTDSLQLDEQEPVAWITEWVEKQVSSSIWSDQTKRALSFTREGAMVVPNPNYIPLYTSPPNRKTLSDEEIFNAWIPSKATPCVHSFKAGVKFAEKPLYTSPPKRETLSDETIAELWGDKHSGKTFMVKNLARKIEKAHGITGVNDETK